MWRERQYAGTLAPYAFIEMLPDPELRDRITAMPAEQRAKLRRWLVRCFDHYGSLRSDTEDLPVEHPKLEDFVRTNLRSNFVRWTLRFPYFSADVAAIYAIASDTEWLYVGRTSNLRLRRTSHAATLRSGTHSNDFLQRYWNCYSGPIYIALLEPLCSDERVARGGQHPRELRWKRILQPIYDREALPKGVSLMI
jgi:hypothetical protein